MAVRILHCGGSIENYELCINQKVAGFINRSSQKGDLIYIAVKVNGVSYCGARGVLAELTDYKPWADAALYVHCLTLTNIEFCNPFDVKVLASVGGQYWSLKFLQGAKQFNDNKAETLLNKIFKENEVKNYINIRDVLNINIAKPSLKINEIKVDELKTEEENEFLSSDEKINILPI